MATRGGQRSGHPGAESRDQATVEMYAAAADGSMVREDLCAELEPHSAPRGSESTTTRRRLIVLPLALLGRLANGAARLALELGRYGLHVVIALGVLGGLAHHFVVVFALRDEAAVRHADVFTVKLTHRCTSCLQRAPARGRPRRADT